eukprot:Pgem_evm1s1072
MDKVKGASSVDSTSSDDLYDNIKHGDQKINTILNTQQFYELSKNTSTTSNIYEYPKALTTSEINNLKTNQVENDGDEVYTFLSDIQPIQNKVVEQSSSPSPSTSSTPPSTSSTPPPNTQTSQLSTIDTNTKKQTLTKEDKEMLAYLKEVQASIENEEKIILPSSASKKPSSPSRKAVMERRTRGNVGLVKSKSLHTADIRDGKAVLDVDGDVNMYDNTMAFNSNAI